MKLQIEASSRSSSSGGFLLFPITSELGAFTSALFVRTNPLSLVKLIANGASYTQPLTVKMDPRVKTSAEGLQQQFSLSMTVYLRMNEVSDALAQLRDLRKSSPAFATRLAELEGEAGGPGAGAPVAPGAGKQPETFTRVAGSLSGLLSLLQSADVAPTEQAIAAVKDRVGAADELLKRFKALQEEMGKPSP